MVPMWRRRVKEERKRRVEDENEDEDEDEKRQSGIVARVDTV